VTRWRAFNALCAYFREGLLDGPVAKPTSDVPWERLINISSQHLVTPALAWCLRGRTDLPGDIKAFFDAALFLNSQRNDKLLGGLSRIVAALNANDVEPILLKGAARLVDGSYPSQSLRFLGDLDLLVPACRLAPAVDALRDVGFEAKGDDQVGPSHHHLPMMHETTSGVGVEIHRNVVPAPFDAIVSTPWFWQQTRPIQYRNLKLHLPDVTRAVAHNIVHAQLHHGQYNRRHIELRQLLDLALIRKRSESEIDWGEIERRFSNLGMGRVLATYTQFADALLGQPTPLLKHTPRPNALADFRWRLNNASTLRLLTYDYVLARRQEPLGVLRLFRPSLWPNHIHKIKAAFDTAV
jgi:hypothetical protein